MTRKIISLFVALTMVCTMTSVSVFATGEGNPDPAENSDIQTSQELDENLQDPDANADQTVLNTAPDAVGGDTQMLDQGFAPAENTKPDLAQPKNFRVLAGYKSVKLVWDKVDGADAYNIGMWNGSKYEPVTVTKDLSLKLNKEYRTTYKFRVMAVYLKPESQGKSKLTWRDIDGHTDSNGEWAPPVSPAAVASGGPVNRLRISFTMKKTKKAHGKKLKKGERVWAEDFGLGKYSVYRGGKRLRVPRVMVKKIKADYKGRGSWNYTPEEAEFFINSKGTSSKTNYLIWVSTYTQHLYVFKKTNGQWKVDNGGKRHWEICMGRKTAPSPTGNKQIQKKKGSRHGIRYWSCYSGWNALHGFKSSWKKSLLGKLASGGCVRNWNSDAKWIYKNCPKGTRVILY